MGDLTGLIVTSSSHYPRVEFDESRERFLEDLSGLITRHLQNRSTAVSLDECE